VVVSTHRVILLALVIQADWLSRPPALLADIIPTVPDWIQTYFSSLCRRLPFLLIAGRPNPLRLYRACHRRTMLATDLNFCAINQPCARPASAPHLAQPCVPLETQ
jgi:hypothetical protein